MPLATTAELADYLGVATADLPSGTEFVLGLASQVVEASAPYLASIDPPPAAAVAAVLAMTARALANPAGHVTEDVLGYSVRYAPQALVLTDAERSIITAAGPAPAGHLPFSGSISAPLAGRRR